MSFQDLKNRSRDERSSTRTASVVSKSVQGSLHSIRRLKSLESWLIPISVFDEPSSNTISYTRDYVVAGKSKAALPLEVQSRSQEAISRLLEAANYTEREAQRASPRDHTDEDMEEVEMGDEAQGWCNNSAIFRANSAKVSRHVGCKGVTIARANMEH